MKADRVLIFRRTLPKVRALRRAEKRLHSYVVFQPLSSLQEAYKKSQPIKRVPRWLRMRVAIAWYPPMRCRTRKESEDIIRRERLKAALDNHFVKTSSWTS